MKSKLGLKLFLLFAVGFGATFVASSTFKEVKAQELKAPIKLDKILDVPARVEGVVGEFVYIDSSTQGKSVKFFSLDTGLNIIPSEKLSSKKDTVVTTANPGTYRLLCYTVVGEELSDPVVCLVVIKDNGKPKPPNPDPTPEPTPEDTTQLYKSLKKAYDAELQGDKQVILKAYIDQLTDAVEVVNDKNIVTVGGIESSVRSRITIKTLLSVRGAIGAYLSSKIAEPEETKLTPELRGKIGSLYSQVILALKGIK